MGEPIPPPHDVARYPTHLDDRSRNVFERRLRNLLLDGESVAIGSFTLMSDPTSVELMAAAGFDFAVIDMEHTALDFQNVLAAVRAAHAAGISPVVRIASLDQKTVMRVLDMGADGIMLPTVSGAAEAKTFAAHTRYPPEGDRGTCTLLRASEYGQHSTRWAEFVAETNAEVLTFGLIETAAGAAEIDGIVAELDITACGRADLSSSLGLHGQRDHPLVNEAFETHLAAIGRLGKPGALIALSPDELAQGIDAGYRVIICSMDLKILHDGYRAFADRFRSTSTRPTTVRPTTVGPR